MARVAWRAPRDSTTAGVDLRLPRTGNCSSSSHASAGRIPCDRVSCGETSLEKMASPPHVESLSTRLPQEVPPMSPSTERDSPFSRLTARPMSLRPPQLALDPGRRSLAPIAPVVRAKPVNWPWFQSQHRVSPQPRIIFTGCNAVWTQFRLHATSHNRKTKMEKTARYAEGSRWCEDSGTG